MMEKELAYQYAGIICFIMCIAILLSNNGNNSNASNKDQKQQFFFQTLIYLISKVIKQLFSRDQFLLIQQQINRLFRTNRFNIIKRRHQKDQIMKQYPILKQFNNKNKINLQNVINKAPEQILAYRKLEKEMKRRKRGSGSNGMNNSANNGVSNNVNNVMNNGVNNGIHDDGNNMDNYMNINNNRKQIIPISITPNQPNPAMKDQQQRSPLICTWLPSRKNMLIQFNRPNYAAHLKISSNNNNRTRIASMTLNNNSMKYHEKISKVGTIDYQNEERRYYY